MEILRIIKAWGSDLLSILFPPLCEVCGRRLVHGEKYLCLECHFNLPRCNIHNDDFNSIHKRLMRHVPIERAAAYFSYVREGRFTNLIQSAKYRNRPDIARHLATEFSKEISASGFFSGIDMIVPVPMHQRKQHRRGYNQAEVIAQGISEATSIPVGRHLVATRGHSTQTRKNAFQRWMNSKDIYSALDAHCIAGLHILVVDDVITTGATLSACCEAIHSTSPDTRISILTLAATELQ